MAGQTVIVSVLEDSKQFSKGMEQLSSKVGSTFATVGKLAAVGLVAAGAAVVGLTTQVVKATGAWEQAAGGVEAVYGKIAPKVMAASQQAYKLGLSSTDFLAEQAKLGSLMQATGMSASKAWEKSNAVMTRAADTASVMGISTGDAMRAIEGMAKGNYTMMDNLGVAMNDTTLKAYALKNGMDYTSTADKNAVAMAYFLDKTQYAAGNAAKEAQNSIEGSFGMLKASWTDLLAGLGQSGSNVEQLIKNVTDSLGYVIKNITPVVQNVVKAIPMLLAGLIPVVLGLIPDLLAAGIEMVNSLVSGVVSALPNLIAQVVPMLLQFVEGILNQLPMILDAGIKMLIELANGITKTIPKLVPVAINTVLKLVDTILDNLPKIIETAITLIVTLALALINALPKLAAKVPQIVIKIVNVLLANIDKIINAGVTLLIALIENLPVIITTIVKAVPKIIQGLVDAFNNNLPKIVTAGKNLLIGLWNGISDKIGWIYGKISGMVNSVIDYIKRLFGIHSPSTVTHDMGGFLVEGLADGIMDDLSVAKGAMKKLSDAVQGSFDSNLALDTVRAGGTVNQYFIDGVQIDLSAEEEQEFKKWLEKLNRKVRAGV